MLLRKALKNAVERMQRQGPDPALDPMVVIGHSQGGLLTNSPRSTAAIASGAAPSASRSTSWMPDRTRELIRRMGFIEPLPFVRRLIFIATPQHGSYFAGNRVSHWVARFVTLPLDLQHDAWQTLHPASRGHRVRARHRRLALVSGQPAHGRGGPADPVGAPGRRSTRCPNSAASGPPHTAQARPQCAAEACSTSCFERASSLGESDFSSSSSTGFTRSKPPAALRVSQAWAATRSFSTPRPPR